MSHTKEYGNDLEYRMFAKKVVPLLLVSPTFFASSCGSFDPETSHTSQMVSRYYKCDQNSERAASIEKEFGNFYSGNSLKSAYLMTANLPDEVLNYIFKKVPTKIYIKGPGRGGFTSFNGKSVSIQSGVGSLAHEFGHAAHFAFLRRTIPGFENKLKATYSQSMSSEKAGMRHYSTTSSSEFFADIFDSYYCSEDSRRNMQQRFPIAYKFVQEHLPQPPNGGVIKSSPVQTQQPIQSQNSMSQEADGLSQTSSASQYKTEDFLLSENKRTVANGDDDQDGVKNFLDLCENTSPNKSVHKVGEWRGCATGEYITDQDGDGISNKYDKCSGTRKGATVWQYGYWMGCAHKQKRD